MRLAVFTLAVCLSSASASAGVVAHIDNATQRMTVSVNGAPVYSWPVSTARRGYQTPAGSYRVQRMERMWHSRKYHMSPMPYSLFFRGGYAIHGTYATRQLGRPASHGCVRLSPGNARALFSLVQQHGGARVVVTNSASAAYARMKPQRTVARRPSTPVRTYPADPWGGYSGGYPYGGQPYGGYGQPFGSWY